MLNPLRLVPQNVTAFEDRAFKEVIRDYGLIRVGPNLTGVFIRRDVTDVLIQGKVREHRKKPDLPTP